MAVEEFVDKIDLSEYIEEPEKKPTPPPPPPEKPPEKPPAKTEKEKEKEEKLTGEKEEYTDTIDLKEYIEEKPPEPEKKPKIVVRHVKQVTSRKTRVSRIEQIPVDELLNNLILPILYYYYPTRISISFDDRRIPPTFSEKLTKEGGE